MSFEFLDIKWKKVLAVVLSVLMLVPVFAGFESFAEESHEDEIVEAEPQKQAPQDEVVANAWSGNASYSTIYEGYNTTVNIYGSGSVVRFRFVPSYTGSYNFFSSSSYDTVGYIYDNNGNQLAYNDDGGSGRNFSITYTLYAGRTYYLDACFYSGSETGSFTVRVNCLSRTECTHSWNGGVVTKQPTCTATGIRRYTCYYCNGTWDKTLSALGHDWANCETTYTSGNYCTITYHCNRDYNHTWSKSVNHAWDKGVTTKAPTMNSTGIMRYTCANCKGTWDKTLAKIPANHAHTWDKGVVTKVSCTSNGAITYTCTTCQGQWVKTTAPAGHNWANCKTTVVSSASGCVITYYCNNDSSHTFTKVRAHTWDKGTVLSSFCDTNGSMKYTCTTCGGTWTTTVAAKGHSWTNAKVTYSSSASGCVMIYHCNNNYDHTYSRVVSHKWNNGVITQTATCSRQGIKTFTCSQCGGTYTRTLPTTAHAWSTSPSEYKSGSSNCTAVYHCKYNWDHTYTKSVSHKWVLIDTKSATCSSSGYKKYQCSQCYGTYTNTIYASHSYDQYGMCSKCWSNVLNSAVAGYYRSGNYYVNIDSYLNVSWYIGGRSRSGLTAKWYGGNGRYELILKLYSGSSSAGSMSVDIKNKKVTCYLDGVYYVFRK